jgi:hypothetical protein
MVLADNGAPWGDSGQSDLTGLGVWLIEHGVALWGVSGRLCGSDPWVT